MQADRQSYLMSDDSPSYVKVGREFSGHSSVNHSAGEYVPKVFWLIAEKGGSKGGEAAA